MHEDPTKGYHAKKTKDFVFETNAKETGGMGPKGANAKNTPQRARTKNYDPKD